MKMETEKPGQIRKQGKNMSNKEKKISTKTSKTRLDKTSEDRKGLVRTEKN